MEVAAPIEDKDCKKYILDFLDLIFSDDVKMRKLGPSGEYSKVENINNINAQEEFMKKAIHDFKEFNDCYKENDSRNNHKILYAGEEKKGGEKTSLIDFLKKIFKK